MQENMKLRLFLGSYEVIKFRPLILVVLILLPSFLWAQDAARKGKVIKIENMATDLDATVNGAIRFIASAKEAGLTGKQSDSLAMEYVRFIDVHTFVDSMGVAIKSLTKPQREDLEKKIEKLFLHKMKQDMSQGCLFPMLGCPDQVDHRLVSNSVVVGDVRVAGREIRDWIKYKITNSGSAWSVWDIENCHNGISGIECFSMLVSYRKQITEIIRRDGVEKMLERLEKASK